MASKASQNAAIPSTDHFIKVGQDAYTEKKYQEALDAFNTALASTKPSAAACIKILDHIVGVHVKLQRLDLALSSAIAIVRHDRTDARGYLRCGQIERLNDNLEGACRWYKHGLKKVHKEDKLRPMLQESAVKTKDQAAKLRVNSKATDPMTALPLEVARMALQHFDYREHTILLQVCKPWKKLLSRLSPIINTIDFSAARKTVSFTCVRAAVRRLTSYPSTVKIAQLSSAAVNYMDERLQLWSRKPATKILLIDDSRLRMNALSLSELPLQTLLLSPSARISESCLEEILKGCHQLRTLVASTNPPAVDESMEFDASFRQSQLQKLVISSQMSFKSLKCFPNLTYLEFQRPLCPPMLQTLDLSPNSKLLYLEWDAPNQHMILPSSLETMKTWTQGGMTLSVNNNLQHIEFACWNNSLHLYSAMWTAGPAAKVHTLAIEFNHNLGDFDQAQVDSVLSNCSNIEHLRLRSTNFGDRDFQRLVGRTPKLQTLIVEDAAITGAFLADLVKADSCIKTVSLRGCSNVSSDTWDWLRSKSITVEVRNTYDTNASHGGRRIVDMR